MRLSGSQDSVGLQSDDWCNYEEMKHREVPEADPLLSEIYISA